MTRAVPSLTPPPTLPSSVQAGSIYENVGRYARGMVLYAFERIGGAEGLSDWARDNKDDFYTKLFPKIITKEVDVVERRGVDELMDVLDAEYEVVGEEGAGGCSPVPAAAPFPPPEVDKTAAGFTPTPPEFDVDDFVEFEDD